MKRKAISLFIAFIMTAQICACGTNQQEESIVTSSSEITEATEEGKASEEGRASEEGKASEEMSEEDKGSFATGILTEDETSEASSEAALESTDFVSALNDEIEERCPASFTATRQDVTYGEFTHGTYDSKTCGLERGYSILLPADYNTDKKYPVLYLLHGIFGNEYSFSGDASNKIKEIVGNMAADGLIDETIIVCCGTRDSVVGTYPKSYHELLETNGTDHIWYEVTGADHDNNVIKSGLYNLFKQIAYDKANP